jgi:hypothetical protein
MRAMSFAPLLVSAAESATSGVNPYAVGAGVLIFFVLVVLALLSFGAGREHS